MNYPIKVALKRPLTRDGAVVDHLVFDEPTLRVNIEVQQLDTLYDQMVALLAGMAGAPKDTILDLRDSDMDRVRREVLEPYYASVGVESDMLQLDRLTRAEALAAVEAYYGPEQTGPEDPAAA
ncbi:hypothetical protein [Tropicimonas sp. IMCC34043]|uniref:hypothetical protein n=1 Tax=Tropicimonas sp. IMCC34043 TaxID=2248760 RepID=UPI000E25BC78|nr:hypothetical protein [Tropicimonas sp. IMCC34043]